MSDIVQGTVIVGFVFGCGGWMLVYFNPFRLRRIAAWAISRAMSREYEVKQRNLQRSKLKVPSSPETNLMKGLEIVQE